MTKRKKQKSVTHRLSLETERRLFKMYGPRWVELERVGYARYVVETRRDQPELWLRMTRAYLDIQWELALDFVDLERDYDPSYLLQHAPEFFGPVPKVEEELVEDLCDVPDPSRDA
jgi:hypothetical protein